MDPSAIRPHRRQFVLSDRPVLAGADWVAEEIAPGRVLSRCPERRMAAVRDAEGGRWTLLGTALATEPGRADPPGDLAALPPGAVPAATHGWAGRWLLIGPRHVLTDAAALLGCFFGRADDGGLVVTSSPALGRVVGRAEPRAVEDGRRLVHESGMSWFHPPRSRFAGLRRVLPSQALDLDAGEAVPRALMPSIDPEGGLEAAVEGVSARLSTALGRLSARAVGEGAPIWLGLTAGGDSRVVLATAARAGAGLRPHTRLTPRMSIADRLLPPRLAAAAGYPHEFHRDRPAEGARLAMLEAHAAGSVSLGDAKPFVSGTRDGLTGALVGGHVFEALTGSAHYRRLPAAIPEGGEARRAVLSLLYEPSDSGAGAGVSDWIDWARRTPIAHLDWRDRLYLESRSGGWLADKEQVFDMQTVERVPLANCAALTALTLGLPAALREAGAVQRALVERGAPALARWPVNPSDTSFLTSRPDLVLRRRAHRLGLRVGRRLGLV